jgi:hypothetical protein
LLQLTLEILSHKFTDVWSFLLQTHGIIITWFSLLRASFLLGIPTLAPTRDWSRDCIPKTCSEHISSRKFLLGHSVATSAEPLILSLPYVILEHPQAYLYNPPASTEPSCKVAPPTPQPLQEKHFLNPSRRIHIKYRYHHVFDQQPRSYFHC